MARNNNEVRFAVIGAAAAVGPYHVAALKHVPGATLVALVDPNETALAELAQQHRGVRTFPSQEAMHASGLEVDVEVIAVPTPLHLRFATAAMEAGHDAMVEKPLGGNVREVEELLAIAARLGRRLHPIAQRRLMLPGLDRRIAAGQLGDVNTVHLSWLRSGDAPAFALRDPRGAFADLAVHHLSLLQALFGADRVPQTITGRAFRVKRSVGEYLALATLDYADGMRVTIEVGWQQHLAPVAPKMVDDCRIAILGTRGSVRGILPTSEEKVGPHNATSIVAVNEFGQAGRIPLSVLTVTACRVREHTEMVQWVREGVLPSVPVDHVLLLDLIDAFYQSSDADGDLVRFDS